MVNQTMNEATTAAKLPVWRRISARLITNSVLLVVVPLVIVVTITLLLTRQQIQTQIFNQLTAVSVLKSQQIENWLDNAHEDLALVSEVSDLRDPLLALFRRTTTSAQERQAIREQLQVLANNSDFESLFVYSLEGNVVAASNDQLIGRVVTRQPYFAESLLDIHTEPPYYDVGSRQLSVIVTQPLYSPSTNLLIGVVAGSLKTDTISNIMLDRTGLGESGETYLVSLENNYFLTPSRFEGYNQNQAYTSSGIVSGLAGEVGTAVYDSYRDVPVYGNYRWIPEIQSVLLAEIDAGEANSIVQQLFFITLVIMVIAIVIAVSFGLFSAFSISRPVEELAKVAIEISEGDLTQQAHVKSSNEIGVLASAFNKMTQQLREFIENLEIRVQERTRDLNIASQVSQEVTRVLDMKQLLPYLSELTKDGFGLSHVSVFVYDRKDDNIHLEAASGKVGQIMLKSGKQFQIDDRGLVPLAARTAEAQIINDVTLSPDHFVNPLLPETRSEMAVPMRVGTTLIGVLDLQSNDVNHFTGEHVDVLITLADQIAVAIRNAQLFQVAEASRKEAEQANIVKSQFLAAMSHELRTPLNAVLNFTQFVSTGMLGEVNNEQVEMLDKVVDSGKHLLSLINDVLDISKIEAGALKLFVEDDVDLRNELDTVLASARALIVSKSVELEANIDLNLPIIAGDKRRIRQIMLNLVSNACKFTDEGTVSIALKHIGDDIHFSVTDTGPGIAPEDQNLIFETFRQTSTGLRQGEGTGLGLPISRRLAEVHGGKLWLESTVGVGSTFSFSIPTNNPDLVSTAKRKEQNHVA